jgi:hypothetical protein
MDFSGIPGQIARLLTDVSAATAPWSQERWQQRRAPGKWSRVEIVGHLIDSARNNTERVVRALSLDALDWPGYQQEQQVSVQHYHESVAPEALALWAALNRHLAYVAAHVPKEKLPMRCHIGASWEVSLEELLLDYVAHMEHHLRQIFARERDTIRYSGLAYPLY